MDNQDWLQQQLKNSERPIADDGFSDRVMAKIQQVRVETVREKKSQRSVELLVLALAVVAGLTIALFNLPLAGLDTWLTAINTETAQIFAQVPGQGIIPLAHGFASTIGLLIIAGWLLTAASCGWSLMQLR